MNLALSFKSRIVYLVLCAAVIAIAGMIPFSAIIGERTFFPMSIAIAPLAGIALGPLAIVAVVFGAFIDLAIAPYTTMLGIFDPLVLGVSALVAGLLISEKKSHRIFAFALGVAGLIMAYVSFIIVHGELVGNVLLIGSTDMIPSIILCLITFPYLRVWIRSDNLIRQSWGVFVISYFTISAVQHGYSWVLFELMQRISIEEAVWICLHFSWWERLTFAFVATVIGIIAIIGLKRLGWGIEKIQE